MNSQGYLICSYVATMAIGLSLISSKREEPSRIELYPQRVALTPASYPVIDATDDSEPGTPVGGEVEDAQPRDGILVRIPLPIVGQIDTQVKKLIDQSVGKLPPVVADASKRPILVLEFDMASGASGEGSEIERCVSLARYLTSPQLNKVRTVAYLPSSKHRFDTDDLDQPKLTQLRGHAVLVALSCEHVVMDEDTAIGEAGVNEPVIDNFLREAYRVNTGRRKVFPEPLVMSMLDKEMSLDRVETVEGPVVWVTPSEREKLENDGNSKSSESITSAGSLTVLSSEVLQKYRLLRHRVSSRKELAERLGIRADVLQGDPSLSGDWRAVHIRLHGPVHKREIDWIDNALTQEIAATNPNLILVEINSRDGDTEQCIRFAQRLAEFNPLEVRTVAFVSGETSGSTSIIAMACDHLIMAPGSKLGGASDDALQPPQPVRRPGRGGPPPEVDRKLGLADVLPALRDLAETKEKNWSLMAALYDSSITVNQRRNQKTGLVRILSQEELQAMDDAEDWADLGKVVLAGGLTSALAEELGVSRHTASSFEEVKSIYQLEEEPELLEPTLKDRWIQKIGRYFSSPVVAGWLLFATAFFFMVEMSNPGIGVPGFIASICCMLFFWSQFCEGNAHWLEILLFIVGLIFLALEIFVVPGIGIFGFGGGLMVIVSIVLAMQDFVFPRTSEQMAQLPVSLSMVIFPIAGFFVSIIVIKRFLPHIPYFNKLILDPPGSEDGLQTLSERESLTHFEHLIGKRGMAVTDLLPSGKARFNDDVMNVITDGRMIEKGARIIVKRVDGNRIEVQTVE